MKQKILILAYPGTGKTCLANNYKNISDLEFQHFRWDYGKYKHLPLELLKGRNDIRTPKCDWPTNFFKFLKKQLSKNEIILVPMATSLFPILDELEKMSIRIIFAIQDKDRLNQILIEYANRGNDEKFIESRKNDFEKFYNIVKNTKYEKVFIHENEYLKDALLNLNIHLEKGVGYKNYE